MTNSNTDWQTEILTGVSEARATTLRLAIEAGADESLCRRIAEARRVRRSGAELAVETRYGHLSRAKCWGRDTSGRWARKDGGTVYLTEGLWTVGSDDGYRRKERETWAVVAVQVGNETWLLGE